LSSSGYAVPIIFITAHGDDLIRPQLIAEGAVACLFKPFEEAELKETLEAAFKAS
jgi:FixJ family two-component response regulator